LADILRERFEKLTGSTSVPLSQGSDTDPLSEARISKGKQDQQE
jgi:hypothetical protein